MAGHRGYRRCTGITQRGERCCANSLPGESVCVIHLPEMDGRRIARIAYQKERRAAYWRRWREARASEVRTSGPAPEAA